MRRYIHNDTECKVKEDAESGYEVEVVDAKDYDKLRLLITKVVESGSTEYDGDDYIGSCRYCGIVSYKPHSKNCLFRELEEAWRKG